jgi:hypothetical protein
MAALVAVLIFDLTPPLAFNDDWLFAWSARQLAGGRGFQVYPWQEPLALPQVVWAVVASLGHPDQRLLRLSLLAFSAVAAISTAGLARLAGARAIWSYVAALALICSPLALLLTVGFMSDLPYLAFLMAATFSGARWVKHGRGQLACVAWTLLAALQRQPGYLIPLAVTLALLLARRQRPVRGGDWLWLLTLWLTAAAVAAGIATWRAGSLLAADRVPTLAPGSLLSMLAPFPFLPIMAGLLLLPFAVGLAFPSHAPTAPRWVGRVLLVIAASGLAVVMRAALQHDTIFPGSELTPQGFVPTMAGNKPQIFPSPLFFLIEAAAAGTAAVVLVLRGSCWWPRFRRPEHFFLLLVALTQCLPLLLLHLSISDRYFLPVAAPLLPLAAAVASTSTTRAALPWAIACLAAGLGFFIVGEQDYIAWQVARDQAARLAYQSAAPETVNAGYEANAVYVALPYFERTGQIGQGNRNFALFGPQHALRWLEFAQPGDPRPGVDYRSLRSGRIIIAGP